MKGLHILALVIFLCLYQATAIAEQSYPIITYTCDAEKDLLKIKNEVKWGDQGKNFPYSDEQGTYNPWEWVAFREREGRRLLSESKKIELSCQLSSNLYKVILQPKIFNVNYLARCGDKISTKVTIFRGGVALLDSKELEQFCHGNAPIIRGIKVLGSTGEVKLYKVAKHKFY
ncbi:MAG: hypothetical protein OQL06_06830 [Gammaproteobacteria bacterium]|nr:hypothetical protein [Gammaproteobacteria bacterium]